MNTSKSSLLTLSLGLMLAAGCSKTNSDTVRPEPAMTEPTAPPEPVVTPEPEPTPEPTPAAEQLPPTPPPLSDGEIAAIAKAANDGEIEHARLAKTKAKDKRVKAYAAMMIKDHGDANKREEALLKRTSLVVIENEAARKLMDDAKVRTETLTNAAKGAEFDRAYMETQVQVHTLVLDMIDNQMLPAAQNPDLKAEIDALRGVIDAHLTAAKEIQAALNQPSA
jgi:putative membrane protein